IQQSLGRDAAWKAFYVQQMNTLADTGAPPRNLAIYVLERAAEEQYRKQNVDGAVKTLKNLIDMSPSALDQGWYLQEMARYVHALSSAEENKVRVAAHGANPLLLKPQHGMQVTRLTPVTEARAQAVLAWMRRHATYEELAVTIADIAAKLRFGIAAEEFERAF